MQVRVRKLGMIYKGIPFNLQILPYFEVFEFMRYILIYYNVQGFGSSNVPSRTF